LPGAALVLASDARVSALMSDDFPTFDRPTNATCGIPSFGIASPLTALMTNRASTIFSATPRLNQQRPAFPPPAGGR